MMGLLVAMARVALVLDKGRRILDEPRPGMTLRTLEISELDLEAIHGAWWSWSGFGITSGMSFANARNGPTSGSRKRGGRRFRRTAAGRGMAWLGKAGLGTAGRG